ncbi:uncharacterized protein N7459_009860 [Penicillium hispanicum]|uniref:uncharacterized protein n=1 Tax=Penicillium hispanicum TaxID=1080232 RepID=UPI002540D5E7|nr:uncharacterized protein N7459_009860 [Penicillium hispanicum]KAJ5570430.1 hypothetical protein N7459_009860 [Penicillium hispanicum]
MNLMSWLAAGLLGALHLVQPVGATKLLEAHSLVPCSDDGRVSINRFSVVFTPDNSSIVVGFDGSISYTGNVMLDVDLLVYGYKALTKTINPCDFKVSGLCPLQVKSLTIPSAPLDASSDLLSNIPGIAYSVPDIDAIVRLNIVTPGNKDEISCVEARVSNGKTVDQAGVSWVLALLTGLGIVAAVVVSILGHSNIATHVSFRTFLFLGFMQSQAMVGITSVNQPPIVQSWTQVFQWSMGLVHADFLEKICTWFQRATGGTPNTLLTEIGNQSVYLAKRASGLAARSTDSTNGGTEQTVRGIERVGFRINIESSNIFMTGYLFFYFVAVVTILFILLLRFGLPVLSRKVRSVKLERAVGATTEWKTFMRGSLYRVLSLGYPQMCVLCMWELVEHDSAAEVVLAITLWLVMSGCIGWAVFKVFQRAHASKVLREHPAYSLYNDPICMTKFGFLYSNYKPQGYYFIIPFVAYTVVKGMVIAFAQASPVAQSIVLLILEAAMLVATAVIRPFMDRAANGFGITAAALNFVNSIFVLVFSDVFNQPSLMTGVMGVLFFLYNAIFLLALLIWLLIGFYYAVTLKEPMSKYTRLSENRESLGISENRMTSELLPLEKAARGGDDYRPASDHRPASDWNSDTLHSPMVAHSPVHRSSPDDLHRAPGQPYSDVLEPSLPLIPSSSHSSGRPSHSRGHL